MTFGQGTCIHVYYYMYCKNIKFFQNVGKPPTNIVTLKVNDRNREGLN